MAMARTPTKTAKKTGPTPAHLRADLEKGDVRPLYYFYGEEDFEREELIRRFIDAIVPSPVRAFNLDIFQGDDMDVALAANQAVTFPMMTPRRLVIIKRAERLPDASAQALLHLVQSPPDTTVLIITADRPDARKKLFSELKKTACAVEFKIPYDNQIPAWIQTRLKTLGRQIDADAAHLLHRSAGSSLRELNSEIEKLLIATGEGKITRDVVAQIVAQTRGATVFDLADALGHRDLPRAENLIKRLMSQGEHPVGILALLIRHFGILRRARDLTGQRLPRPQMAAQLKISPFFVDNYVEQARNFSSDALWRIFEDLLNADNRLKSRARLHHHTLSELAYRICRVAPLDRQG